LLAFIRHPKDALPVDLVYLDYNCFQRPFDNPLNARIQLEAVACVEVFSRADRGILKLVWSFIHQDEATQCPFLERKLESLRLGSICANRQGPTGKIYAEAEAWSSEQHLSGKDALHLASAMAAKATHFLTCDDRLLRRAGRLNLKIALMNPVDYIRGA
jgi:predicted nucleic acid-binding protein